jgi:hypothetical protein
MQARLVFVDEVGKDATGARVVAMTAGSAKPPQFARFPERFGAYEIWTAVINPQQLKNLFAVPRLGIGQSAVLPDGKAAPPSLFEIETRGLESAWNRLASNCQAAQAKPRPKWPWPSAPPTSSSQATQGLPPPPAAK